MPNGQFDTLWSKIPTDMETFGIESAAMPSILMPHFDVAESQLQRPLQHFVCEKRGLFEPAPISHERHTPPPSLDINLLQYILNTATDKVVDSNNDSRNTKRKNPSSECQTLLNRKHRKVDVAPNFRPYQESQWVQQYHELVKFKEESGHCDVPHSYKPDMVLQRWVKRQRYQYKLRSIGKVSSMTEARMKALESIGFVWDAHAATWLLRFEELKQFRASHGHCDVPSTSKSRPKLATWVKCQRRQYRLFMHQSELSHMTLKRIVALEEVGFKWRVRED